MTYIPSIEHWKARVLTLLSFEVLPSSVFIHIIYNAHKKQLSYSHYSKRKHMFQVQKTLLLRSEEMPWLYSWGHTGAQTSSGRKLLLVFLSRLSLHFFAGQCHLPVVTNFFPSSSGSASQQLQLHLPLGCSKANSKTG